MIFWQICLIGIITLQNNYVTGSLSDPQSLLNNDINNFHIGKDYVHGSVWPKPQQESRGEEFYTLNPKDFSFHAVGKKSDILTDALKRYPPLIFPDKDMKSAEGYTVLKMFTIDVLTDYEPMTLTSDESYALIITNTDVRLTAVTVFGALRGLETFSQVVYQNESGAYFVQQNKILDHPRFHHRGFHIDTSRHYVSVKVILQFLDAMSYSKFNVLHWHIVDDDSFPYVSTAFPQLHNKGARNNKTHIYNPIDVKNVIEYARLRGIRVIPEFDTPGHTRSWSGVMNLLTKCYSGSKPNGNLGPVDPTNDVNYEFFEQFFREVAAAFPDEYIHMGGDEVSFSCWQSNPDIKAWMKEKGMAGNYSMLEQYYEQKLLDIIKGLKKQYIIWQEVIDNKVKVQADTVVNVWKGGWPNEMAKVTQLGYRAILSSCWYLNYISYGEDWRNYYKCDPENFNGTPKQKELVMGGTACMWGEMVDGTNLISRTWARGLAVGERLWSDKSVTDMGDAYRRIWEHRCRYVRRGLPAENVVASQYCRHEWQN